MSKVTTGAEFRAARQALGLTQKQMAEALRMGKYGWQSISSWESAGNDIAVPGPAQVAVEFLIAALPPAARPA
jgi:transcriptional regulator with XRE-family HTH domain